MPVHGQDAEDKARRIQVVVDVSDDLEKVRRRKVRIIGELRFALAGHAPERSGDAVCRHAQQFAHDACENAGS